LQGAVFDAECRLSKPMNVLVFHMSSDEQHRKERYNSIHHYYFIRSFSFAFANPGFNMS
jgi:hypothetical protein